MTKKEAQARLGEIEALDLDALTEDELAEVLAEIDALSKIIDEEDEKDEKEEIEETKETEETRICGEDEEEEEEKKDIRSNTVNTEIRGFNPHAKEQKGQSNMARTLEQRNAYRNYLMNGIMGADLNLRTGDTANTSLIPVELQREIIRKIDEKEYGFLYKAVRKLNVKGGIRFATSTFDPTFSWITDGNVASPSATSASNVTFTYNICELRIQRTVLAQITEIDAWENTLADIIAESFLKCMDGAIISGTGSGQPTGLLHKTSGNYDCDVITLDDATSTYGQVRQAIFGNVTGAEARNGSFCMTWGTYLWIQNMAIADNYPVEAIDVQNKTLFGRPVIFVEDGLGLANVSTRTLTTGDVIAIFGDFSKYALNFNKEFEVVNYENYDNNTSNIRAQAIVDGQILNPKAFSLVVVGD